MAGVVARQASSDRPFFGRPEILVEVERAFDAVGSSSARGILLSGPEGIGKTEVARAVADQATARGFRVVQGRGLPEELAPPFSLARDLLNASAASLDHDTYGPVGSTGAMPLAGFFAGLQDHPSSRATGTRGTAFLPEGLEDLLAPSGNTMVEGLGAARDDLRRRFVDHFLSKARDRPTAVLVDDLHLADALSLDLLEGLAREGREHRLIVVATMSSEATTPTPATRKLRALLSDGLFKEVKLRPLTVTEAGAFASWLLRGSTPTPEEILRWHTETEGNPLCVELLVRSVAGAGLRRAASPEPFADVLQALLDRARALEGIDRRVLTYASVFGHEFAFPKLQGALGLAEDTVSEAVDRLVQSGILRERGAEVYEFVSEGVWATIYSELTETRRAILHRKVATALENRSDSSDFELARHFYLGRHDPKAVEYNLRAAESATRTFAFETALSLVRRALEATRRQDPRDLGQEVRLLTEAGRLLNEIGELGPAEETLHEAVTIAREAKGPDADLGRSLLALAWTRIERSAYRDAEPFALEAAQLLELAGRPRDVFAAHRALGTLYWRLSDLDRAEHHQRAALAIAEKEGNPHERGHALIDVANTLLPRGGAFVEATLALYEEAAGLFSQLDDPSALARVRMNRAVLLHRVGRTDEALGDIGLALDAAERSRSPIWIGYCLLNLAQWQAELGRTSAATELLDRAERTLRPTGDHLALQQVEMIRGLIAEREGRFADAERRFADSQESARRMGTKGELAELLWRRARLAARVRDTGRARELLAEARASGVADYRADLLTEIDRLERELHDDEEGALSGSR